MVDIQDMLYEEFIEAADTRGENPADVLERLVLEYIRQDRTITEIFADDGMPVNRIDEYDATDDRPLGYDAAEYLPTYSGSIEIDPEDITDDQLPQSREVKREVILGVLRYLHANQPSDDSESPHETIVRPSDVMAAAEAVVGDLDTDYKRSEYFECVIDEKLLQNPDDERMLFLSPSDAVAYLKSLESGFKAEQDAFALAMLLGEEYSDDVDWEAVNAVWERLGMGSADYLESS